jgi:hypothetical protein
MKMLYTIGPSDIVYPGTFPRYNFFRHENIKLWFFCEMGQTAAKHVKHKLSQTGPIVQNKTSTQICQ